MNRALAVTALLAGAAAVVVAMALVIQAASGDPDGGDLAHSLDRVGGQMTVPDPCEHTGDGRWRCVVEDDPGSGQSGEYRLALGDDGCWAGARPVRRKADRLPLKGCISFLDRVGF